MKTIKAEKEPKKSKAETYLPYALLQQYVGKSGTIKVHKWEWAATFTEFDIPAFNKLIASHIPEMRQDARGKNYRPLVIVLAFNIGRMYFVLEDTVVTGIARGFRMATKHHTLDFTVE